MRVPRLLTTACVLFGLGTATAQEPTQSAPEARATGPLAADDIEVRYIDGSTMKLKLRDPSIELETPFGPLKIPAEKIHRIEFATRIPPEDAARAERNVTDLGSEKFKSREAAMAELLRLGERAYPELLKAVKSDNPEVASRAKKLIAEIRSKVPAERLVFRPDDVVHTSDSRISGRISVANLKVHTFQFGEQDVKLSDVMSLRSLSRDSAEASVEVLDDPGNLIKHQEMLNKVLHFRVTGAAAGGGLWGTDTYTSDSSLATAAVHAGVLRVGQTGVVKVRIVAPPAAFDGSTRNGVNSFPYGQYPGAYQVVSD